MPTHEFLREGGEGRAGGRRLGVQEGNGAQGEQRSVVGPRSQVHPRGEPWVPFSFLSNPGPPLHSPWPQLDRFPQMVQDRVFGVA